MKACGMTLAIRYVHDVSDPFLWQCLRCVSRLTVSLHYGWQVAGRKASKILSEMRIGKQKAEAKRKSDGSPEGSPSNKKKKVSPDVVEGVLNTLMDIAPSSAPHPAPNPAVSNSSLQQSQHQGISQFAAAPLPAPQSATSNPALQGNQPVANYLSAPSNLRQDNAALWGGSIFGQLQGPEQHIGETVPVAAALTSVFQDQYITSDMARRPSPSTHDDDDDSD
jgi:hypothetical protein